MKKLLRLPLLLSLPLLLFSCEEGVFGPRQPECLETRQTNQSGLSIDREYSDKEITSIRYSNNGVPSSSFRFTYGPDGRITESQYTNESNGIQGPPEMITYNDQGKWATSTFTYPNGNITTQVVEYDNLNQIKSLTSSTNRSGTITVNYTYTYDWEGGNNTRRTYTSPTQQQVVQYAYDLDRENKRRKEQEKLAFFSAAVSYNKNMHQRIVSKVTTDNTTTEAVSDYSFEYNEEGYPTRLTRTTTTGSGNPAPAVTEFYYDCN